MSVLRQKCSDIMLTCSAAMTEIAECSWLGLTTSRRVCHKLWRTADVAPFRPRPSLVLHLVSLLLLNELLLLGGIYKHGLVSGGKRKKNYSCPLSVSFQKYQQVAPGFLPPSGFAD